MSGPRQSAVTNRLLSKLRAEDYDALKPQLEPLEFPVYYSFAEVDEPVTKVLFLDSGIASVVIESPEGQSTEGGVIGLEGFVVPSAVMGADRSPYRIQSQITGNGHSIDRCSLIDAMNERRGVRDTLLRFAHVMMVQASSTLLSNAVHQIDERLARWLLMCHDRCDSDDIPLTHEFMSLMLAVRRPSVTNALHTLEGNGFIRMERGYVGIRNRAALEDFAGDAYGKPEAEYARLLGAA